MRVGERLTEDFFSDPTYFQRRRERKRGLMLHSPVGLSNTA